jgi:hypothetical protein
MSSQDNNQSNGLPVPGENRKTAIDFLPGFFKTEANKKFLQSTIDQLIQPGVAEKVNAYFGRKTAKAFKPSDNYLADVSASRQSYQFEPAAVIKDELDNVVFYKDYNDYINQIESFGGDVSNHSLINRQESYGWNPNIDWDKIVNYRDYYWLPNGPVTVPVRGQSKEVVSTYSVTVTGDEAAPAYLFSTEGLTSNPRLTLYRGQTYRFDIDTPGYPIAFAISRTVIPGTALLVAGREGIRGDGLYDSDLYDVKDYDLGDFIVPPDPGSITFEANENVSTLYLDGIDKFNETGDEIAVVFIDKGTIEFTIPFNAPDRLFYISKYDINVSGIIKVANIEDSTFLNVESDILGKKTYLSANGVRFTNGQKVNFPGEVVPEKYSQGNWYVEGVGDRIKLINESDLVIPARYTENFQVPFDSEPFDILPFSDGSGFARSKDYHVIGRASNDRNPWSRYNRWFHRQVIEQSAQINGMAFDLNEDSRAKRPIIEFEPGLKLYNYGTVAKRDVDLIDTFTQDVFSTIEGSIGYNVDKVDLAQGMRVLFTADPDILVNGKIYTVNFIEIDGERQISLVETDDSEPLELETVFVKQGAKQAGKTYYYIDGKWKIAQEKTTLNQPPLFDLCCPTGREFADSSIFESTSFVGTKVFSYKHGHGPNDPELGFPLTYRSIDNTGDIVFEFNLLTDTFVIQESEEQIEIKTDTSYLRKYSDRETFNWVNGYSSIPTVSEQPVLRQYIVDENQTQVFEIDMFDNATILEDLKVRVFVNNQFKVKNQDYKIDRINNKLLVRFDQELKIDDVVLIKAISNAAKNNNGFYEFPYNLERNPKNEDPREFTLGEIADHVGSMIERIQGFEGSYPGSSNLRDLGELDHYGLRFVKHSGPINLPLYHITNKNYNLIKAIRFSKSEYSRFKRNFVRVASTLGFDGPVKQHVDKIFVELNQDRIKTEPFYFSDMVPSGPAREIEYEIIDPRNSFYSLSKNFSLNQLSPRAVLVYLNQKLLIAGQHYNFDQEGFLVLTANQQLGDILYIYEYDTTDGSFVPPTPTKLGLYPKFMPEILVDDTYITGLPDNALAYKIYGQTEQGELGWFYPVYSSKTQAAKQDSNGETEIVKIRGLTDKIYIPKSMMTGPKQDNPELDDYPRGVAIIKGHDGSFSRAFKDYRDNLILEMELRIFNNIKVNYDLGFLDINDFVGGFYRNTKFSKNQIDKCLLTDFIEWLKVVDKDYTLNDFYDRQNKFTFNYSSMTSPEGQQLPGFWRGVYVQAYDTDRPHTAPWEMLGFAIKPSWWNEVYGPAPYTSNNLILWEDLEAGIIREPGRAIRVDSKYTRPGLVDHLPVDDQGRLRSPLDSDFAKNFFFRFTTQSFKFGDHSPIETAWRKSSEYPFAIVLAWLLSNPAQIMGLGFDVSRIKRNFAGQLIYTETGKPIQLDRLVFPNTVEENQRIQTSGLVNYIYNLVASNILTVYDDYRNQVKNIQNNMGIKIAGFTEKNKFRLLLDSRSPRQKIESTSFVPEENYQIFLNTSSPIRTAAYSAVLIEKTPGGFIVRGYNQTEPFFKYYKSIRTANDVTITVGGVSEKTVEWRPQRPYVRGQVLENNNEFYRVTKDFTSGGVFTIDNLVQLNELPIVGGKRAQLARQFETRSVLELPYGSRLASSQEVVDFILGYSAYLKAQGFEFNYFNPSTENVENWEFAAKEFLFWTTQGWAAGTTISLSPSASEIVFRSDFSVVDDLYNGFYDYTILKSDGQPLEPEFNNVYREQNTFTLRPKATDDGIYHIRLPLVQKEHVVLLDNKTVFNDLIYQPSTGYRQERIKVLGYRTDDWRGGLNIPGFVFDEVNITVWSAWRDYRIGEVVKHKEFYYVAVSNVTGSEFFDERFWFRLNEKPESKLMTNFDYRINQFTDFYDLDSDGFDLEKQRLAQHIIGYQKRKYLENIINDDVSQFKFYQGYIREKGTANSISKLFDALSNADKESLEMYEEWAVQIGQYGALDNFEQIEIQIDDSKIKEVSPAFELVEQLPTDTFDNVYRVRPFELYEQPSEYNSKPFPVLTTIEQIAPTDGYVDLSTVSYKVESKIELANADANQVTVNDYIWLLDDGTENWTVLQYYESFARALFLTDEQRLSNDGLSLWSFTIDRWSRSIVEPGEFVAVKGAQIYGVYGFYEVESVDFDRITVKVNNDNVFAEFEDESFVVTKLRSVRVENLDQLNDKTQEKITLDQKIWVDQYDENNNWAVLENQPQFNKTQEIFNPNEFDSTTQDFGAVFSCTADNRRFFVSAPGDINGKVFFYKRNDDKTAFKADQIIEPPENIYDINQVRFGESVSVSEDGKFLAIGSPNSSNIKTKFKGQFDPSTEYNKGDTVKFRESLWKANRRILPEIVNQQFNTFNSYFDLASNFDTDIDQFKLLFVGNIGLADTPNTDHILVRAPIDQYLGSKPGDKIYLKWNRLTFLNNGQEQTFPFDNRITPITPEFISQGHIIADKVDVVLLIQGYDTVPSIGQIVTTSTGSARVVYISATQDSLLIYINNIEGIILPEDTLFIDNDRRIGLYTQENTFTTSELLGGFWMITTPLYNNLDITFDRGKNLIYQDLTPVADDGETFDRLIPNIYFNIQDSVLDIGPIFSNNLRASIISHLTYEGNPGNLELQTLKDRRWLFRLPKNAAITTSDEVDFLLLPDNVDLTGTGFSFEVVNGRQTVFDVWDGYIDFTFNNFDFNGEPFQLQVGDTIEDVQTPSGSFVTTSTSTAEVVFYQRRLNNVRVYIKILSGNWQRLSNIVKFEIRRLGTVNRIVGVVKDVPNDIVVENNVAGKFAVIQATDDFELATTSAQILESEYFVYVDSIDNGVGRSASVPTLLNKDYTQVYNISANIAGDSSEFQSEGSVSLYRQLLNGQYRLVSTIVSEHRNNNKRFGSQLKFAKEGELYKLFISSEGNQERGNSGTVEIYYHGPESNSVYRGTWKQFEEYNQNEVVEYRGEYYEAQRFVSDQTETSIFNTVLWKNISWRIGKDRKYRGEFDNAYPYSRGSIVSRTDRLFVATRNILAFENFNFASWSPIDLKIDYLGYLPNQTGLIFYGQDVWDPAQDIEKFSESFDVSQNGSVLVVTTKQVASDSTVEKSVLVYRQFDNKYLLDQVIPSPDDVNRFAEQVKISPDGQFIAISESENDDIKRDQGKVYIYSQIDGKFELVQELFSPNNEINEKFGYSMSFGKDNLVIASLNGDMTIPTTFDRELGVTTTFDRGFTQFNNIRTDSGVIYVYELLKDRLVYAEQFVYENVTNRFGQNLLVSDNHVYVGMPQQSTSTFKGVVLDYRKPKFSKSWNVIQQIRNPVDLKKIKSVSLYNKRTNQLVAELDYIDPIQGKIAAIADREISYKTAYDPAFYTNGIISNLINPDQAWGAEHEGTVWWKINSAKFAYPYFGSVQYQKNVWNQIPSGFQVEVYEWVRSSVIPSEWDRISNSDPGNERGISGQTRYGNDFFSQKFKYDEESKSFRAEYYFWVRNKISIPNYANRRLSVFNIRRMIEDPRSQNYQFVNFLGADRFVINNCESLFTSDDVILSVQYRTNDQETQNRHIQYQLISDGLETSEPHLDIERKWFDSLIGYDEQFRIVPDPVIPAKQKYGVQNDPRQSMFVNRQEALKQYIESVNLVLKDNLIVDYYDISSLDNKESLPSLFSGLYDIKIDTDQELRFVSTLKLQSAILEPVIVNGRLTRVNIVDPGRGYQTVPSVKIEGIGSGAEIEMSINNQGGIESVTILNRGLGYDENTQISVRSFAVLVENDSQSRGKWAIYHWNKAARNWDRALVQSFDVTLFWDYSDWYAQGYNEFTTVNYQVGQTFEIDLLPLQLGDVIKINSVGSGGWMLIEKVADEPSEQFSTNYKIVGRENGTIQFNESLYDFRNNAFGYNSRSYDSFLYDNVPVRELRTIFNTVKNNLFIGELKIEYNRLFIAALHYVLSEQLYVDWLFKTGFIKIKHNLGKLEQSINFKADTLDDYREYVEEVKPYTSNIREFISAYEANDNTNTQVTDFDLSPVFNPNSNAIEVSSGLVFDQKLVKVDETLKPFQNQSWFDNFTYNVKEISISNPGSGYTLKPVVTLEGGGGTGAKAEAYLGYGKITKILVTDPGQGYITSPTVIIEGSQSSDGIPASATAVLGNGVVRNSYIGVKFDRIFGRYYFTDLHTVETFEGTNINNSFDLEWPMQLNKRLVKVFVNNKQLLRSEYTYTNVDDNSKSYLRKKGRITFTKTPELEDIIRVEYSKSIQLLSAEDRIQFEYKPTQGMQGQDLGQLMDGVDYGGVEIRTFDFNKTEGWDLEGWDDAPWDVFDDTIEDEIFTFDGSTTSVNLSKPLDKDVIYNLYLRRNGEKNAVRIDDPAYGTDDQTNLNAIMSSISGDGITIQLDISELGIFVNDGDELIIRKITSDGSFKPDPETYDLDLSGGDLTYQSARGISAEEIVVDGDGFVTPTTSKGPEELVPGQILDALDIKVYTRTSNGQGVIYLQHHKLNSQRTYNLGVIPNSGQAVLVKVDSIILDQSNYTIDWNNNTVILDSSVEGVDLHILTMSQSGQNIVDIGRIQFDGSTQFYDTGIKFNENYQIVALHQGSRIEVFASQDENTQNMLFGFTGMKPDGDAIDYIIFDGDIVSNYSQVTKEQFVSDGVNMIFNLDTAPFFAKPSLSNVIVKVGNEILSTGYNVKYTIAPSRPRRFELEKFQIEEASLTAEELRIFLNGEEIFTPQSWIFDSFSNAVLLQGNVGFANDLLEIFVTGSSNYNIADNQLILATAPANGTVVEIFKFSNHDILNIERINYDVISRSIILPDDVEYVTYQRLTRGEIALRKPAIDSQYVWVTKNRQLLTPNVDYYVTEDKQKVQIAKRLKKNDSIEVIHFAAPASIPSFAFRQFKDMLNRTHYKKLDSAETVLAKDLNYYDLRIEVEDASNLSEPNKSLNRPGVIFIDGERIEYFVKEGNLLRQLRRGTLGTGVKTVYDSRTPVFNQSSIKNIPYKDRTLTHNFEATGVNLYDLGFDINSINDIEVFVSGKRLNKTQTVKFDPQLAQDSPEGDIVVPADFELIHEITVDQQQTTGDFEIGDTLTGSNSFVGTIISVQDLGDRISIRYKSLNGELLPNVSIEVRDEDENQKAAGIVQQMPKPVSIMFKELDTGSKITIVKKIGKLWTEPGVTLGESENDIAGFLKYNKG